MDRRSRGEIHRRSGILDVDGGGEGNVVGVGRVDALVEIDAGFHRCGVDDGGLKAHIAPGRRDGDSRSQAHVRPHVAVGDTGGKAITRGRVGGFLDRVGNDRPAGTGIGLGNRLGVEVDTARTGDRNILGYREPRLRLLDNDRDRQGQYVIECVGGLLEQNARNGRSHRILPPLRQGVARHDVERYSPSLNLRSLPNVDRGILAAGRGKVGIELVDEAEGRCRRLVGSLERDRPVGSASRALREQLRPRAD